MPPIRPLRPDRFPANEFQRDLQSKQAGDNRVTTAEARELTQAWGTRALTPQQADQLRASVNNARSTFDAGATQELNRFVNVTLPRLVVRQGLGLGANSAKLSWDPVTRREDGTPLTELKGYRVHYGPSPGNYTRTVTINDPAATSFQVDNLPTGTWYFAVTSFDAYDIESGFSNEASKTVP